MNSMFRAYDSTEYKSAVEKKLIGQTVITK